ncbi:MAG TPA: hypothetical protein VH134_03700 [Candidatus Dormibacteraeota bacterium]|nr:hypothetical protein [Candidatus Dormibacteraeota bacterium]
MPTIPPALEAAAASLRSRYADRHDAGVIEGTLLDSYQRLASTAKVQDFVPIFAERSARQRLDSGDVVLEGTAAAEPATPPAPRRRSSTPRRRATAAGSE